MNAELSGQSEARGRNGWFAPVRAEVVRQSGGRGRVFVDVSSSRAAHLPAITMTLTVDDARVLLRLLREVLDTEGGEA